MLKKIRVLYPYISTLKIFSLVNIITGKKNDATIEPNDTYPDERTVTIKNPTLMPTSTGASEISIPRAVLIPFPPLKFTNTENV